MPLLSSSSLLLWCRRNCCCCCWKRLRCNCYPPPVWIRAHLHTDWSTWKLRANAQALWQKHILPAHFYTRGGACTLPRPIQASTLAQQWRHLQSCKQAHLLIHGTSCGHTHSSMEAESCEQTRKLTQARATGRTRSSKEELAKWQGDTPIHQWNHMHVVRGSQRHRLTFSFLKWITGGLLLFF